MGQRVPPWGHLVALSPLSSLCFPPLCLFPSGRSSNNVFDRLVAASARLLSCRESKVLILREIWVCEMESVCQLQSAETRGREREKEPERERAKYTGSNRESQRKQTKNESGLRTANLIRSPLHCHHLQSHLFVRSLICALFVLFILQMFYVLSHYCNLN